MEKFKKVIKSVFSKKALILIIILVLLLVVILPASYYFITIDDAEWDKKEKGKPSSYTQNVKYSNDNKEGLIVDKDAIIKQSLIDLGYTEQEISNLSEEEIIYILGLKRKINKDKLDNCTQAEILWCSSDVYSKYLKSPDELERLLNAEIITQYPKTGKGNLDGIIEFERHKTDGTTTTLKYIENEAFNQKVQNGDISVLNNFSLDSQGQLLIAVNNTHTEELTTDDPEIDISEYTTYLSSTDKNDDGSFKKNQTSITIKPAINYKNMVQKYTMPFQYLWDLLVISDDRNFVLELAKLVENSQITISIYDNITTTSNTSEYTYKKETRIDTYAEVKPAKDYGVKGYPSNRYWVSQDSPDKEHYLKEYEPDYMVTGGFNVKYSVIDETNTPTIDLTKADVWIVDYSKEYTNQVPNDSDSDTQAGDIVKLDNTDYIADSNNPETSNKNPLLLKEPNTLKAQSLVNDAKKYIKEHMKKTNTSNTSNILEVNTTTKNNSLNIFSNTNTSSSSQSSDEVEVNVSYMEKKYYNRKIERTQKIDSYSTAQKYIAGPTKSNPKVDKDDKKQNFVKILSSNKYKNAKKIINQVSSWLFEILESDETTSNMVDLTKYLLYKVTGKDYGFTEYDFSVYGDSIFSGITGGIYGNSVQEKVWYALKSLGYSDVAVAGVMGNIQHESGFKTNNIQNSYESELGNDVEYTNKINDGKYTESDFSKDGAGYGLAQWTWHTRKKGLYQYAKSKEANIDDENIQVQYLIGELSIGGGADGYAKYMLGGTVNGYTASDWENAKTVEDATKAFCYVFENPGTPAIDTRIIYAQQFYEMYQGRTAPEEIETDLTGENKENMQLLIAEAKRIANDDSYTYSQTYREAEYSYDCSSFVSRLYTQYFGISRLDSGSGNRGTDNIKINCTSQYTVVNMVSLQPGDILWKDGHVALYIGNNQIAEAKNTERGIVIGTYKLGSFTEAYRIIK